MKPTLLFKTARERAAEKPPAIDWVIQNLAAAGIISELDGQHKASGKTTFLSHAVKSKLEGRSFLGGATKRGPVVWLTEESWATFQEPIREAGLLEREDLFILCREDTFGVVWSEVARQAREKAIEVGANLLIGDTVSSLAGLRGDEENSSGANMEALRPIQEIAAAGIAVLASRHDRRAGGEVGESGRGSSAFSGAVDMIFRLSRLGGEGRATMRKLDYIGRIRGVPESRILELTDKGYVVVGTESDVKRRDAARLLLDHLPDREEDAVTLPKWWAELPEPKPSKNTCRTEAEWLVQTGKLARKVVSDRRHLFWCVSNAPVPIGHIRNKDEDEAESGRVSSAHTPIRGEHTWTPDTNEWASNINRSSDACPVCSTPCVSTGHGLVCPRCTEAAG